MYRRLSGGTNKAINMEPKIIRPEASLSYLAHPPSIVLSDGDLELALPCVDDVSTLAAYGAAPTLLEGIWVSGSSPEGDPYAWAQTRIDEFLAGWEAPGGPHGAALAIRKNSHLVGFAYLSPLEARVVELSYGVAPPERCLGIATRAARLASGWALTEGGFDRVQLYVSLDHHAGHRVADKAGFRRVSCAESYIEATGVSFIQVIYERM